LRTQTVLGVFLSELSLSGRLPEMKKQIAQSRAWGTVINAEPTGLFY
jgi:hypothetical protein